MSFVFDLVGKAVHAVAAARSGARVLGHETPVLDELHQGLSPVRHHLAQERAQELGAQLAAPAAAPPGGDDGDVADLLDSDGGGLGEAIAETGDGGGGLIAGAVDWILDNL